MLLETKRLILRELTPEDLPALLAVLGDREIMVHYPVPFDEERVRGWIERNMERYRVFGFGLWAATLKETGELIGDCGLTMQPIRGFIRPEIGYHIRRDQQRRGYAAEAARACRDWAFRHTPFQILYSYMKRANLPSSATAAANGMRRVEDYLDENQAAVSVYAITRREWLELGGPKEAL